MNKTELINNVYRDIISHKQEAEHNADIRYYKIMQNKDYAKLEKQKRALVLEQAKCLFENTPTTDIDNKIKELKTQQIETLGKLGYPKDFLDIKYHCNKCKDTGFIDNDKCVCLEKKIIETIFSNSNLTTHRTFKDFNVNLYDDKSFAEKLIKFANKIIQNKAVLETPTILFKGKVGVGKTYFLECLANELINEAVVTVFMTAFEFSQKLLEWHLGTFEDKNLMQQMFIDCDVLIIDDLGTEPIYQNVSVEYLQNIIDLRMLKKKLTIISTNLETNQFFNRYGDRLGSRLLINHNSLKIEINNKDLRQTK